MNRRGLVGGGLAATMIGVHLNASALAQSTPAPIENKLGLCGNAHDLVPLGEGDGVEVVAIGGFTRDGVQVIIRNNTKEAVSIKDISGGARDSQGKLMVVSERASTIVPSRVEAGGIVLASMFFGAGSELDPDWEYDFAIELRDEVRPEDGLKITEVAIGKGLDGYIESTNISTVEEEISILAHFFNEDGTIQGYASETVHQPDLERREVLPFKAMYFSDMGDITDRFLVGLYRWSR